MIQYTYRAEWLPDEKEYIGRCLEFPLLWSRGITAGAAIADIEKQVEQEVADLLASEMDPPESLTDRHYTGKFMVRASPMLHARLTVEASEQGVSLNQWVIQKLAGRPPVSLSDLY